MGGAGGPGTDAPATATTGLPPVVDVHTRVLVLGSLPSQRSIELQQYYGNARNAFWRIMGAIADAGAEHPYPERLQRLRSAGIGLWDVLAAAVRPGSLDARIELASAQTNDFQRLLSDCPSIRCIGLNGKTAARLFRRDRQAMQAVADRRIELADLPSTSPAHAAMSFDEKCRQWSAVVGCYVRSP